MSVPKRRRADSEEVVSDAASALTCDTASSVDLDDVADVDELIAEAFNTVPTASASSVLVALISLVSGALSSWAPCLMINGGVYVIGGIRSVIHDGIPTMSMPVTEPTVAALVAAVLAHCGAYVLLRWQAPKQRRKQYTIGQRLAIVAQSRTVGYAWALKHYDLDDHSLCRYIAQEAEYRRLVQNNRGMAKAYRVPGPGRKLPMAQMEERLKTWFEDQKRGGRRVTEDSLYNRARVLCRDLGENVQGVTPKWLYGFKRRNRIALQFEKRHVKRTNAQLLGQAQGFHAFAARLYSLNCTFCDVFHFDESPMSFSGLMDKRRSLNFAGQENVISQWPLQANDYKRCGTFGILVSPFSGVKRIYIIFKGRGQVSEGEAAEHKASLQRDRLDVSFTDTGSVNDRWIVEHLLKVIPRGALLVWDHCHSHVSAYMSKSVKEHGIMPLLIPKGLTSFLQWLDTSFFAHFRRSYVVAADNWAQAHDLSVKVTARDRRSYMKLWTVEAIARSFHLSRCHDGMKTLGYIGWQEDPQGKRLSVRGLPDYVYDPTDSLRLAEKYDTALKRQIPSLIQRGGLVMQWSRPHSGLKAPLPTMLHGGIIGAAYLNDGLLVPDMGSIPPPPPPKHTKQITLDGFFKRKRQA